MDSGLTGIDSLEHQLEMAGASGIPCRVGTIKGPETTLFTDPARNAGGIEAAQGPDGGADLHTIREQTRGSTASARPAIIL